MSSIPRQITDLLKTDLLKINKSNGYSCDVAVVNDKLQKLTEVNDYITINLLDSNDKLKESLEENEIREVDIFILAHCNESDSDNILNDLTKFLYKDESILSTYHNTLATIPNLLDGTITLKNNNYIWNNNKKTIALVFKVTYYQERQNIEGTGTVVIPNILNSYSITSHTHTLINNDLEVNGNVTTKELYVGSELGSSSSGKVYLLDAPSGQYKQILEQGDTKLILGVNTEGLEINSKDVLINSPVTCNNLSISGEIDSNLSMFDSPNAEYKQILKQGDSELYLSNTANELRILSKDSDNANIYLNNKAITEIFSATGHTHTSFDNLTVNGTLSANKLYFTSTTAIEFTVTGQELNFLGSVSITGDSDFPYERNAFEVYKNQSATNPDFIVTTAGNVGIGTINPNYLLHLSSTSNGSLITIQGATGNQGFGINLLNSLGTSWIRLLNDNNNLRIQTNTADHILNIKAAGSVGLGTEAQSKYNRLSVYGSVAIGTNYVSSSATTNGLIVEGNVGIGTTAPTDKLSISGNISVTGNIITNGLTGFSGTITAGTTMIFTNGILTSIS